MDISSVLNQISPVNTVVVLALVIAVTEVFKLLVNKDYKRAGYIVVAGLTGLVAGLLLQTNLIYTTILGLSASGLYKLAQTFSSTQNNIINATNKTEQ